MSPLAPSPIMVSSSPNLIDKRAYDSRDGQEVEADRTTPSTSDRLPQISSDQEEQPVARLLTSSVEESSPNAPEAQEPKGGEDKYTCSKMISLHPISGLFKHTALENPPLPPRINASTKEEKKSPKRVKFAISGEDIQRRRENGSISETSGFEGSSPPDSNNEYQPPGPSIPLESKTTGSAPQKTKNKHRISRARSPLDKSKTTDSPNIAKAKPVTKSTPTGSREISRARVESGQGESKEKRGGVVKSISNFKPTAENTSDIPIRITSIRSEDRPPRRIMTDKQVQDLSENIQDIISETNLGKMYDKILEADRRRHIDKELYEHILDFLYCFLPMVVRAPIEDPVIVNQVTLENHMDLLNKFGKGKHWGQNGQGIHHRHKYYSRPGAKGMLEKAVRLLRSL